MLFCPYENIDLNLMTDMLKMYLHRVHGISHEALIVEENFTLAKQLFLTL